MLHFNPNNLQYSLEEYLLFVFWISLKTNRGTIFYLVPDEKCYTATLQKEISLMLREEKVEVKHFALDCYDTVHLCGDQSC